MNIKQLFFGTVLLSAMVLRMTFCDESNYEMVSQNSLPMYRVYDIEATVGKPITIIIEIDVFVPGGLHWDIWKTSDNLSLVEKSGDKGKGKLTFLQSKPGEETVILECFLDALKQDIPVRIHKYKIKVKNRQV